jgi:hypothetical protein
MILGVLSSIITGVIILGTVKVVNRQNFFWFYFWFESCSQRIGPFEAAEDDFPLSRRRSPSRL